MREQRTRAGIVIVRLAVVLAVLAALSAVGAVASTSEAQGARPPSRNALRGQVRDESGRPLSGASLAVVGTRVAGESDDAGAFTLAGLAEGEAALVVRRIGFAPETLGVIVANGVATPVVVALRRIALPLDAVVVHGRRYVRGPMAGFYARMERGNGRFITGEQIDRRNVRRMSDLLRGIPGLRIESRRYGVQSFRLRGATVAPLVWLDGAPMGAGEVDLDNFDPRTFAGIEIYSGPATVPAEYGGSRTMTTSGGTIILWTRQGELAAPRRRAGTPSPALLVAGMLDRREVFTRDSVDTPARPASAQPFLPNYPDSLYAARLGGTVEVEFVVDASGRLRMDTFGVVSTTHRTLGEAVRRSLAERAWIPAIRSGRPVPQLVQLPFDFLPDSGVVARKPKD